MIGGGWIRSPAAPLLAGCALLGCILVVEWLPVQARPDVPALRLAHPASQTAARTDESRDTDEWSDTVLERPLFSFTRRPAKNAAEAASGGPVMPRLAGIMISSFGKRAIFMPDTGKPLVVAEGAKVDNATIRRITTDAVYVSGPAGESVLHPTLDKQRASTGPASGTSPFVPPNRPFPPPGGFRQAFQPPQPTSDDSDNNDTNDNNAPVNQMRPRPFPGPPGGPGNRGPILPRGRDQ
jgi:hypothetical protein